MNSPVFGHVHTGYAVIETRHFEDWTRFAGEALGLHTDEHGPDLVTFRVDDRARRLIVRRGAREDFASLGLEVSDPAARDEILHRLKSRGVAVQEIAGAEAALRGVVRFWSFLGPKRQVIEVFENAERTDAPLRLGVSGFQTGDAGLCHLAITSKDPNGMMAFWRTIFDARMSDQIEQTIAGINLNITFLRMNERHHSIAVARTKGVAMDPIPTRIQHMAFQVAEMEDVTRAFERCRAMGYRIALSIGQHTNDREVSFYAVSPSGFEVEIGWNPLVVDESTWDASAVHQGISIWGHKPQDMTLGDKLGQFRTGIASLLQTEFMPF